MEGTAASRLKELTEQILENQRQTYRLLSDFRTAAVSLNYTDHGAIATTTTTTTPEHAGFVAHAVSQLAAAHHLRSTLLTSFEAVHLLAIGIGPRRRAGRAPG